MKLADAEYAFLPGPSARNRTKSRPIMSTPAFTAEFSLHTSQRSPNRSQQTGEVGLTTRNRTTRMTAGVPVYGNWCGPGHGGESGSPIDPVDQVCCRHDKCYDSRGYFDCSCDRTLLEALPAAIADPGGPGWSGGRTGHYLAFSSCCRASATGYVGSASIRMHKFSGTATRVPRQQTVPSAIRVMVRASEFFRNS